MSCVTRKGILGADANSITPVQTQGILQSRSIEIFLNSQKKKKTQKNMF